MAELNSAARKKLAFACGTLAIAAAIVVWQVTRSADGRVDPDVDKKAQLIQAELQKAAQPQAAEPPPAPTAPPVGPGGHARSPRSATGK